MSRKHLERLFLFLLLAATISTPWPWPQKMFVFGFVVIIWIVLAATMLSREQLPSLLPAIVLLIALAIPYRWLATTTLPILIKLLIIFGAFSVIFFVVNYFSRQDTQQ